MATSFEPDDDTARGLETLVDAIQPGEKNRAEQKPRAAFGGLLQPFQVFNYRLLFSGQTISTMGDALYMVALPWLILTRGGGAQELGIVLTAYGIPRAGSVLLGGWLSDRLRPRWLMLLADAVRAVLVTLLAALAFWGHPNLWQLCAVAIPLGTCEGLFLPASMAILPDILNDDQLQAGNALSYSSTQAATLVGTSLAGVVVASLGSGSAMVADALTFVASAVSLLLMRAGHVDRARQKEEQAEVAGDVDVGRQAAIGSWRFLRTSRLFQMGLLVSIAANFCVGGLMEVALPTLVHGPMRADASSYGLILAALSAGALGGGVFAGMLSNLKRKGLFALLIALVMAGGLALVPDWHVPGAALSLFIAGAASSIVNVLFLTIYQLIIPRHLMGRMMGLLSFASFGTYPLSAALVGVLTTQFGPAILFPSSGLLLALVVLLGLAQKELREA